MPDPLKPWERFAYAGIAVAFLVFVSMVGLRQLRQPAAIVLEPGQGETRGSAAIQPVASLPTSLASSLGGTTGTDGGTPPGPSSATVLADPSEVVIHVAGAVAKPGLVRMPPGSRVDDALQACGGAKADADLESLNLAAKLEDGTQLFVAKKGTVAPAQTVASYQGGAASLGDPKGSAAYHPRAKRSGGSGTKGGSGDPAPGSISLNTASAADLDRLPGVGPATARAILEYREQHGGFTRIEELLAVRGIGAKKLAAMKRYLRL